MFISAIDFIAEKKLWMTWVLPVLIYGVKTLTLTAEKGRGQKYE